MQNHQSATDTISERAARALKREKRKDHPSASPEPPVKPVKPVKKQKRARPARQRRNAKSSDNGCIRPGLPYGESDSGEECINVALPQYILDRIKAEEDEDNKKKAEEDDDKKIKAENKESVEGPDEHEPAQLGVAGPTADLTGPHTNPVGYLVDLPVALHDQQPYNPPVYGTDTAMPIQESALGPGVDQSGGLPELDPNNP